MLDTEFRMPSIGCSLFLWLGRTFSQKSDDLVSLPNRTGLLDRHLYIFRHQCRLPSQQQRRCRVCPTSLEAQLVPKRCAPDVHPQLFGSSGNQGLSANDTIRDQRGSLGILTLLTSLARNSRRNGPKKLFRWTAFLNTISSTRKKYENLKSDGDQSRQKR